MSKLPPFQNIQQFINEAIKSNPNITSRRADGQQLVSLLAKYNSNPEMVRQKANEILQEEGLTVEAALGPYAKFFGR